MEAVILIGLQAAGKSTFCKQCFFRTHLRINLDMLRTRYREQRLLEVCVQTGIPFVVDNTNPSRAERAKYITAARNAGFRVRGYYFRSRVADCLQRNEQRPPEERIPERGILATAGRIEVPAFDEGFDELSYVWINSVGAFVIEPWISET